MKISDPRSGLTLAELLVAMTISTLVLVLLSQGINNVSNWSRSLANSRMDQETTTSLFRFIHERLIRVEPLMRPGQNEPEVLFLGTKTRLHMVLAETQYPATPGLYEYVLQITPRSGEGWELMLARLPLPSLAQFGQREVKPELVIYSGLAKPEFSYRGLEGWQSDWPLANKMPQQFGFALTDWPNISIALPAAIDADKVELDVERGAVDAS